MMKHLVPLLLVAMTALPACARLGETEAEIEKRYGQWEYFYDGYGATNRVYKFKDFEVTVRFIDGKSESEFLCAKRKMDDEESLNLIRAIAGVGPWNKTEAYSSTEWHREADATYGLRVQAQRRGLLAGGIRAIHQTPEGMAG